MTIERNFDDENNWKFKIITNILKKRSLIVLVFDQGKKELRDDAKEIIDELNFLSSGELVLVKISIDLWLGSTYTNLNEIIHFLDTANFQRVIKGMELLRSNVYF